MAVKISKTQAEQEYADQFQEIGEALPGGSWVKELRTKAIAKFEEIGLPHRRVEEWKYSDLRAQLKTAYNVKADVEVTVSKEQLNQALGALANIEAQKIVFINGQYTPALSDRDGFGEKVEVLPLEQAFEQAPDWFANELSQVSVFNDNDTVIALNTAFVTDGAAIHVSDKADGANPEKPIHLVFMSAGDVEKSNTTRYLVSAGNGNKLSLLETHVNIGNAKAQNNSVCELIVGSETEVDHIKCQLEGSENTHLSTWMVRIGGLAKYRAFQMSVGAKFARNQVFVRFLGEDAYANISGVFLGREAQHNDTTLVVDHAVPHCSSQENFKFVLADQARGVFQGKLCVQQDAQKTDAKQMAQALLLSETAEFDAKPELEIFADDVVCGHGATSGQIDEELLFYLRARGIPEEQAKSLLIGAFIGEVLEIVEDEKLREALGEITQAWLEKA